MGTSRKEIAEQLTELRTRFRHTQKECAAALGVAQSTYADMEAGRGLVRRRDLVTIAVLYGLDVAEAFPGFETEAVESVA